MKSSTPVFTRQNPFEPASKVGKAHHHPSRKQSLSKKEKKTTLSPERLNQRSSAQLHSLSPENQRPYDKRDLHFVSTDRQPVFEESWPSTDCGSSLASSTSSDMETSKQSARAGKSTFSSDFEVQQSSVMAKYIDRFRNGQPQSREERQQMPSAIEEKQLPFWWMSPSSLPCSSTPTKTTDREVIKPMKDDHGPASFSPAGQRQHDRSPSPCRGSLSILSDTSQMEFDDAVELLQLQEKANQLLLRGECTLSDGSILVSSEGLDCSDFSSPVSVDEPPRRPLIPSLITSTAKACSDSDRAVFFQRSSVIPSLVPPTRREEDILFQWRLRRKIEQAREWPPQQTSLLGPTFSWQAPSSNNASARGQAYKQHRSIQPPDVSQKDTHLQITAPQLDTKEAHKSSPPASGPPPFPAFDVSGSSVSHPQTIAHVPAHMHLLCDVLPCPIQSSHATMKHKTSKSIDRTKIACKKIQVPANIMTTITDQPSHAHMPCPTPASSGIIERVGVSHQKRSERSKREKAQTKESEKKEEKAAPSIRKQKKSTREHAAGAGSTKRSSSQPIVSKKVMRWAEQPLQEQRQGFSRESCTGDHAPPPSPIHRALGQVISEVMFPTADSAQRSPDSSVSPPCPSSAPPQSTVPPCNAQNSMEVISQLLQEAEDSDEKEFEDDALLQVLRKQRKWVKEQISDVDSILNEFQDEREVT
ncbi:proline and serine-rich protein 3 isoform X1 [Notothenia coriiceps]|uniref:Proline and serine-rich protein 3 isoform X1 n=1 Tax=Notothenia coriiceps TaxID=8208 RepID=A0A6I9PB49_9TELE|nr:PREDICTED: proline and serine-rich protein 3 isoform X1 [Notothenia coriiceps]XP_010787973.1 PREDICTED: proline and serine-rich protein 3 isoform X1 [Notothenia coriiceps]XP_010787974.1 PREDICTED: proline and serine-rich protein 3 isoform X1 [Notothenia coriiceps]